MQFDLVVVGSGIAGRSAVRAAMRRNLRIALVESGETIDGDFVPGLSELERSAAPSPNRILNRLVLRGLGPIEADPQGRMLTRFSGSVRFQSRASLLVGDSKLTARRIVIATGSKLVAPSLAGLQECEHLDQYEALRALSAGSLSGSVCIVGDLLESAELASAASLAGLEVMVCDYGAEGSEPRELEVKESIRFGLERSLVDVWESGRLDRVNAAAGDRSRVDIVGVDGSVKRVDSLVICYARRAALENLNVEFVGVALDRDGFIKVDNKLQTTIAPVFAVGDVTGLNFTSQGAEEMARIAISHAFDRSPILRFDPKLQPRVILTVPEVAMVGDLPKQGAGGLSFGTTKLASIFGDGSGLMDVSYVKLVSKSRALLRNIGGGKLIGAVIVGEGAAESISEIALAIRNKLVVGALAQNGHARPSIGQAIQLTAQKMIAADPVEDEFT